MPKNSANKQYLSIQNSSLLNDVKDSTGSVIYPKNPSLPQPPIGYSPPLPSGLTTGVSLCFNYDFSSTGFTETKTPSGSFSGFTYYNLTHGVVWTAGAVYWYWTDTLGDTGTTYGQLYNGGQNTPNSLSYNWGTGASETMNSSLIGSC
jgi:hypothetical protein